MIDKISIKSFKSIQNLKLELGNVNVFLGANGSGKTNILETIGIVSAAVFGVVDDESLLRRGVRPGVPRLYKMSNKSTERSPHIAFYVWGNNCEYRTALLNPLDKTEPYWPYKTELFVDSDGKIRVSTGIKKQKRKHQAAEYQAS